MKSSFVLTLHLILFIFVLPAYSRVDFLVVKGPSGTVSLEDVDWHSSQNLAITVGRDGSQHNAKVYLYYDTADPYQVNTPIPRTDAPSRNYRGVRWHPSEDYAILVGEDKTVVRYDLNQDVFTELTATHSDIDFHSICTHPSDGYFYMAANVKQGSYDSIHIYRTDGVTVTGPVQYGISFVNTSGGFYCPSMCWRPDGDYLLVASVGYSGFYGLFAYDPDRDTFPGTMMSHFSRPSGNYYSVEFNPRGYDNGGIWDYYAFVGISTHIYRLDDAGNGSTNGSVSLQQLTGLNFPYAITWHTLGEAAICAGRGSSILRFDYRGQNPVSYNLPGPLPSNSYLFAGDWRPLGNRGLLVGEESWIVKFIDSDAPNMTPTPSPTTGPSFTPTETPTITPTPTNTGTYTKTPTSTYTPTVTPTPSASPSGLPTSSPTVSPTPTISPTSTITPTRPPTSSPTPITTCCWERAFSETTSYTQTFTMFDCDDISFPHFTLTAINDHRRTVGIGNLRVCFLSLDEIFGTQAYQAIYNPNMVLTHLWTFQAIAPLSQVAVKLSFKDLSKYLLNRRLSVDDVDAGALWDGQQWVTFDLNSSETANTFDLTTKDYLTIGNDLRFMIFGSKCEGIQDCAHSPTPTATLQVTQTPSATDTPTMSPTPVPTETSTPCPEPQILLAGYMSTDLSHSVGGSLWMLCLCSELAQTGDVEIHYQGTPSGVNLPFSTDVWELRIDVSPGTPRHRYLLELVAKGVCGESDTWPYFTVQ